MGTVASIKSRLLMSHDKPLPTWCSELGSMVDVMELQNVPRNILGYATTSMSLSADHRPKALLGRLSYSTLTAKPDSIQTSTIKESRTTSRSPSVITQGGGGLWIEGASKLGTPAMFDP